MKLKIHHYKINEQPKNAEIWLTDSIMTYWITFENVPPPNFSFHFPLYFTQKTKETKCSGRNKGSQFAQWETF